MTYTLHPLMGKKNLVLTLRRSTPHHYKEDNANRLGVFSKKKRQCKYLKTNENPSVGPANASPRPPEPGRTNDGRRKSRLVFEGLADQMYSLCFPGLEFLDFFINACI
jgi:hypothetical protein